MHEVEFFDEKVCFTNLVLVKKIVISSVSLTEGTKFPCFFSSFFEKLISAKTTPYSWQTWAEGKIHIGGPNF